MRVLDLFSGIGGFSLGLERAGMKTVAFCEINPFCRLVLAKHWPEVPCYDDIRTLAPDSLGPIDLIAGGFPCQPFSSASRGRRVAVNLWPDMFRLVAAIGPRYVIAENVTAVPIGMAAECLQAIGYRTYELCISAAQCGADHQRDRWWCVAYPDRQSELPYAIHAKVAGLPEICRGVWGPENYAAAVRVPNGFSYWLDRVEALGNAVIPQIPEIIGRAIMEAAE